MARTVRPAVGFMHLVLPYLHLSNYPIRRILAMAHPLSLAPHWLRLWHGIRGLDSARQPVLFCYGTGHGWAKGAEASDSLAIWQERNPVG